MTTQQTPNDGTGLIQQDPWLANYAEQLRWRYAHYLHRKSEVAPDGNLLGAISQGHLIFGLNRGEKDGEPGVWYREWAPAADYLALVGDFNGWDRAANPLERGEYGVWYTFLPDKAYSTKLTHGSRVKVHVGSQGSGQDRIPAYIRRVVQEGDNHQFVGQYWQPAEGFVWRHSVTEYHGGLRIYEAHAGMSLEEGRVGTWSEFTHSILPRIKSLGYNAVQLMAVMEHPYYGSFGYHVSNLYAPSSRFGTPEDLKELIDTAHGLGLRVIMDVIHSHSVKNMLEGLNRLDGTSYQYFHDGPKGEHPGWDSLLFDYSKYEVLRLLLSNIRYWLEEFHFDGFRFDGVTSMLYLDHGIRDFTSYDDYFGANVDADAVSYLMLANELAHTVNGEAITIAEDVSGMPGMASPVSDGGLGFNYRLAMGVPDTWIKLLKHKQDEEWNLGEIYSTLLNRRHSEKHIGYAESHDQALVGDKTIAFWLMDQEMYWNMGKDRGSHIIDRGMALHKMIRLLTFSLAGEGYLNFMGNEFGHPEWVDFPREGNGWSYSHARRQWSLVDTPDLKYSDLNKFDAAMQNLDEKFSLLPDPFIEQLLLHESDRILVYRRGPLVFAFNFHTNQSYADLRIPVPDSSDYRVVLDTDAVEFGGFGLVYQGQVYAHQSVPMYGRSGSVQIYLPARSAQVLVPLSLI